MLQAASEEINDAIDRYCVSLNPCVDRLHSITGATETSGNVGTGEGRTRGIRDTRGNCSSAATHRIQRTSGYDSDT